MKYTITIDQVGVARAGLADKTDLVDWAIIDYLIGWQHSKHASIITDTSGPVAKQFIWCSYQHLIDEMPLLGIKSKSALSDRFTHLEALGLIETYKDNERVYIYVTPKAGEVRNYDTRNDSEQTPPAPLPSPNKPFAETNTPSPTVRHDERIQEPPAGIKESQPNRESQPQEVGIGIPIPTLAPKRKASELAPTSTEAQMLFEKLRDNATAKGRRGPLRFPTLECKHRFDAAVEVLGPQYPKALEAALTQGITKTVGVVNYLGKWAEHKQAPNVIRVGGQR